MVTNLLANLDLKLWFELAVVIGTGAMMKQAGLFSTDQVTLLHLMSSARST